MFYYEKCVLKASRLLFSLFIINHYCTKNGFSKQVGSCNLFVFLIINQYCTPNVLLSQCLLKASRRLLFSFCLIDQYCSLMFCYKNMCSKQMGGYLFISNQYCMRKMFYCARNNPEEISVR